MKIKLIGIFLDTSQEKFHSSIIKRYSNCKIDKKYTWKDIEFIPPWNKETKYDVALVLNTPDKIYRLNCHKDNIFAVMQEPGHQKYHLFMHTGMRQYTGVFSPLMKSKNVSLSHGFLGWSINKSYSELHELEYRAKKKPLSTVTSNLTSLYLHKKRFAFLKNLKEQIDMDWFGRGVKHISDKWDGLAPYQYSVAIENTSIAYYFTEKINDCFLAYTIPFYYGCANIHNYFPKNSYIWIDIERPQYAIDKIKDIIQNENPEDRKNDLIEARRRVLEKYHLGSLAEQLKIVTKNETPTKKIWIYPRLRNRYKIKLLVTHRLSFFHLD